MKAVEVPKMMDGKDKERAGGLELYRLVRTISGKGVGRGQFSEALRAVAVDDFGLIHAVGDSHVKVFEAADTVQHFCATERPGFCIAFKEDGTVYVGEPGQIEKFERSGKRISAWRDEERLSLVTAIGFLREFVIVADARDRCLRRFDRQGQWINDIGKDNRTKGFLVPNGYLDFDIDPDGVIHAVNPGKHRIERYSLTGELLGFWGRFGTRRPEDFGGCCNPTNLALTREGHIVVTEKAGPRVKVYDSEGKLLALVGSEAFDANCKNMDVAADAKGWLYVVDTVRLTISVFAPEASGA